MATSTNIEDFTRAMEANIRALAESMPAVIQVVAMDATAAITKRIQKRGQRVVNEEETSFPAYSTNKLPTFFFADKGRKSAQVKLARKKYKDGISYKDWREFNGKQTAFVDLTFTARMMNSIGIIGTAIEGSKYSVVVGSSDEEGQKKINFNSIRYGDILALSKKEKGELNNTYGAQLDKVISKFK